MKRLRHDVKPLSPEEVAHLEKLKSMVEKALENGTFSIYELDRIKALIWADGKVSYEELRTVNETIEAVMGDEIPDREWEPYSR
ncbi:MAG: hypothetical protein SWY16_17150 [Cyanobacteriota bacterium]|nr:hypothetical protein [Cyanobacteriota bacterium]